jgi:tripartite-type tricarboxylate transporter receptor subunit TctC
MTGRTLLACILSLALLPLQAAIGQPAWPSKPIRIVVPFAAGSFTDLAARAIAAELAEPLGQQVIVENRAGAGGTLGADAVAKAAPDGHTLLLADNSFAIAPGIYAKLPYDPHKDFVQISTVAESPTVMVARINLPAKTLKEVIDLAKVKPGNLTFGSGGQGSSAHLATELFLNMAGVELVHVPFKGVAAAFAEVVANRIDITFGSVGSGSAHIRSGRVRGIALTGRERSPLLPEVPTFAESGFPGYTMVYWFGIMAPAATPSAVVSRLHDEIVRAAANPRIQETFSRQGAHAVTLTPAEFARNINEEMKIWQSVITKAGVKAE